MKIKYIKKQPPCKHETIAIIGCGWNGGHFAWKFAEMGYQVTVYEGNSAIFSGISGKFGIRIHAGPHYPRSEGTRKGCRLGFYEFCLTYPMLINQHEYSIYAIAAKDADGEPSKVSQKQFEAVCQEFQYVNELDVGAFGCNTAEILSAFDINEPSAILGPRLRRFFEEILQKCGVEVKCNFFVTNIAKNNNKITVGNERESKDFDYVINTTSYQSLLPAERPLPLNIKITYQICSALVYKDLYPSDKPISFIVMDGWFPCLMPYDDREEITNKPLDKYILTHGKWTIIGSYDSAEEAKQYFSAIDDDFIEQYVKAPSEAHMAKLWPMFSLKYQYLNWIGAVLAKIQTNTEFRSSITFQDVATNVIYVFPGKITNVFEVQREALALMVDEGCMIEKSGYRYSKHGVLNRASGEITERIEQDDRITCKLQTSSAPLHRKCKNRLRFGYTVESPRVFKKQPVRSRRMSEGDIYILRKSIFAKRERSQPARRSLTL